MIDAKIIVEAAIQNADKYNPCRSTLDREEACRASFKDGIEWFKNAIWHKAKEEPEEHKFIITQWLHEGEICYEADRTQPKVDWQNHVAENNIIQWCYIDDLLPKGGEK